MPCRGHSTCRLLGFRDGLRSGSSRLLGLGGGQQDVVRQVGREAGSQPGLVGRVFQQAADQVGHAGNHFAHRHVLADPQTLFHQGLAERIGHAVQLLEFDRRGRQAAAFPAGPACRRSSGHCAIPAASLTPPSARAPRQWLRRKSPPCARSRHRWPACRSTRARASPSARHGPLRSPSSALDQPHGHLASAATGPVDQPTRRLPGRCGR